MSSSSGWPPRLTLLASGLLGFALRAHTVFTDDGINWPDEIYQSFEPAHRLVFGYGLQAWEYLEGARHWATPAFVAGWLWLCRLVGADAPATYIHLVKLVFSALSLLAAGGTYRLARTFGAQALPASLAAATWSLCALALYFSPRAMSENLAAVALVWGLALVFDEAAGRRGRLLGSGLLGLSVLFRLQSGVVCAVVLGVFAFRAWRTGAWRPFREVLAALGVSALLFGATDALAWHGLPGAKLGGAFHSAFVYWRVNIVENRGASWGTSGADYYFRHLFLTMPGVTLALLAGLLLSARRAWALVAVLVGFFALHFAVPHKELRFLVPIMPAACAFIALGLTRLPPSLTRLGVAGVAVAVGISAATAGALTMGDVGSYPERKQSSAWDDFGPINRLLLAAHAREDLCGLRVDAHLAWVGGSTYLHRPAPLYMPRTPVQTGHFNYVLTHPGSGAEVVAREGNWELVRLPRQDCTPDPGYSWRLP